MHYIHHEYIFYIYNQSREEFCSILFNSVLDKGLMEMRAWWGES